MAWRSAFVSTPRDGLGLVELMIELPLQVAQVGEVLIQPRAVLGAHHLGEPLGAIEHAREHALARQDARVGREGGRVRVLVITGEQRPTTRSATLSVNDTMAAIAAPSLPRRRCKPT